MMTEVIHMDYTTAIQLVISIAVWSLIAYVLNYAQGGKDTPVNWIMLAAYEIVGFFAGLVLISQSGGATDMAAFMTQMALYIPYVGFVDIVITQIIAAFQHKQTKASLSMTHYHQP
jgi:hypothetical protein